MPLSNDIDHYRSEKHDHPTLAADTVSEDTSNATCTDPAKAAKVTELSSIASFANIANGLPRHEGLPAPLHPLRRVAGKDYLLTPTRFRTVRQRLTQAGLGIGSKGVKRVEQKV